MIRASFAALGLFAGMIMGCPASRMTTSPLVMIDDEFTADEREGIEDGLRRWEVAIPEFSFRRVTAPHNALAALSTYRDDGDRIWIIRNVGVDDESCAGVGIGDGHIAITHNFLKEGSAAVCFDSAFVDSVAANEVGLELAWRRVTMHEVGHAMGLNFGGIDGMGHMLPPSVMAPGFSQDADDIQCSDRAAMHARWGLDPAVCDE